MGKTKAAFLKLELGYSLLDSGLDQRFQAAPYTKTVTALESLRETRRCFLFQKALEEDGSGSEYGKRDKPGLPEALALSLLIRMQKLRV